MLHACNTFVSKRRKMLLITFIALSSTSSRIIDEGGIACHSLADNGDELTLSEARNKNGRSKDRPYLVQLSNALHEHPLVDPQVSHFRHVPLRTMVKLPHSEQLSPS